MFTVFFKLLTLSILENIEQGKKGSFQLSFISFYVNNGNIEETSNACVIAIDSESKGNLTGNFSVI